MGDKINRLMLQKTTYNSNLGDLKDCYEQYLDKGKHTINQPTGNFFYDPWIIREEFKDTVWEKVLNTLTFPIGEARIIVLETGNCYLKHADIDDRFHLNIGGDCSYLLDLEENVMHDMKRDGAWYKMNAGVLHTAINVGEIDRVQLVVRELLSKNTVQNPIRIKITGSSKNARYIFDSRLSPWLNRSNKKGILGDFAIDGHSVLFSLDSKHLDELKSITPSNFKVEQIDD